MGIWLVIIPPAIGGHFWIARSIRLSVPWRSCLGYRHAATCSLATTDHHRDVRPVDPSADGRRSTAIFGSAMAWLAAKRYATVELPWAGAYCLATLGRYLVIIVLAVCFELPSMLWRCWLGGRKGIRPVKTEWWGAGVVICLERGADLHIAQLMPLPLTVSCFSKIQIGFTFLVPAHPGSPGKRAVKRVCVCVAVWLITCKFVCWWLAGYLKLSTRQLVLFMKKRANEFIVKKEKDPAFALHDRWPVVRCCCCLTVETCVLYLSKYSCGHFQVVC